MAAKTKSKTKFKYDVFISYSSKDKEWVRGELLERIEEAGLRAFRDFHPRNQNRPCKTPGVGESVYRP